MNLSINEKILERLDFLKRLGDKEWGKQVTPIIKYNLKGQVGGMACYPDILRVNLPLLFNNEEDYLEQTIGHEYAHLLTFKINWDAKPHGMEWKRVMWSFDLEAKRCHNYDTNLPKVIATLKLSP
jgi:SprT protein